MTKLRHFVQRKTGMRKLESLFVIVLIAAAWPGCRAKDDGRKDADRAPPDSVVQERLQTQLPAFIAIRSLETNKAKDGSDKFLIKFKAVLAPKEYLYTAAPFSGSEWVSLEDLLPGAQLKPVGVLRQELPREMTAYNSPYAAEVARLLGECERMPRYRKLKIAHQSGQEVSLYGKVSAETLVDKWQLGDIVWEGSIEGLGKPRGSFGPEYLVVGSPEAGDVGKQYLDARTKLEAQLSALVAKYKADVAAKQQAEERAKQLAKERAEANFRKLLAATAPGTKYSGTAGILPFVLEFTKQEMNGMVLEAKIRNPKDSTETRLLTGSMVEDSGGGTYSITLKLDPSSGKTYVPSTSEVGRPRTIFEKGYSYEPYVMRFSLGEDQNLGGEAYVSVLKRLPGSEAP